MCLTPGLVHEAVTISGCTGLLGLVTILAVTIDERPLGPRLNQPTTIYAASILPFAAGTAHVWD